MENKPKYLKKFKILGYLCIVIAVVGLVLSIIGLTEFQSAFFMVGGIMFCVGIFAGIVLLSVAYKPEVAKLKTKMDKYIQEENKEDLTDIASTSADIKSEAITKTVKAIKKGIKNTKFCKHCGEEIDADSKFCSKCGKEQ